MSTITDDTLQQLQEIVGKDRVACDEQSRLSHGKDWTTAWQPNPCAVVFPGSLEEVVAITRLANEKALALVPSGGRTGLSGGAVATNGELVVSMDRLNKILDFNPVNRQLTCQAGVVTEQIQIFAEQNDLFYPVDFASAGSSHIGGNVATNAGGIKVIRYGMTRNWVEGLKVVTGNGDVLDLNRGLAKNATGYDFRHLFIGSEGSLGTIVEVTLSLTTKPKDPTVLVLGLEDLGSMMKVLERFQNALSLTAFEFFSELALNLVIAEKNLQRPFETQSSFYALIEFENDSERSIEIAMDAFEQCMEDGWITDGTISQNLAQAQNLWRLREDISETISQFSPYKNDISVTVSAVPEFLKEVDALVDKAYPNFRIVWFGHIGDGNVHLNILKPEELTQEEFFTSCNKVSESVFQIVAEHGGSISAEHGVGLLKKPYLGFSRSDTEIDYMKSVKQLFDPNGIMNPGKLFDL